MVKVAILGLGTVGTGVAEVLSQNAQTINAHAAEDIELKYILDIRDFPESPFADKVIHDFAVIESDPEIRIVVETIGGLRVAYEYTRRAILAGKSVVTSNKELVAERGAELIKLAREQNVNYLFEASVGGGIPIIRPLTQCLSANDIHEITGVLNGTTNYILTRMQKDGVGMDAALKEAQANGYAEANPAADIEGLDACRKICILADLAFGHHIAPSAVTTEGISEITQLDMRFADSEGYVIKLLGRVVRREDGRINLLVAPHLIPADRPLAGVSGVFNGIIVIGNAIDEVMFYGRGAGKMPTASAVAADIIDAAKHLVSRKFIDWCDDAPDFVADTDDMIYRHYVRLDNCTAQMVLNLFPHARIVAETEGAASFVTVPVPTRDVKRKVGLLCADGAVRQSILRILG